MPERDYGFAVGRIRVLETRLLDRGRLERLAEAADLPEALNLLGETEYAVHLGGDLGAQEIGPAELARVRDMLLGMTGEAPDLDFLLWRWDLLNLKALLRDGEAGLNALGRYEPSAMRGWFKSGDPKLPEFFTQARRAGEEAYAAARDPQALDAAIDRFYYGRAAARWGGESYIGQYWRARVDLTNLRILVRSKLLGFERPRLAALLLPGGTIPAERLLILYDGSWEDLGSFWNGTDYAAVAAACPSLSDLPGLEKASENFLLSRAMPAKGIPLGIEPVLGYYLAKEHETRLVTLVLAAKAAGVPGARIKERLRGVYV